jgi:hypothetical protein
MMTVVGIASAVASWAVSNADPANMVLAAVVYWRLVESHDDLKAEIQKTECRIEDLQSMHNGDE